MAEFDHVKDECEGSKKPCLECDVCIVFNALL